MVVTNLGNIIPLSLVIDSNQVQQTKHSNTLCFFIIITAIIIIIIITIIIIIIISLRHASVVHSIIIS